MKRKRTIALIIGTLSATMLAFDQGGALNRSGSAEDEVIVFSRYFPAGEHSALCVTDPSGSRTSRLRVFKASIAGVPALSPDGDQIAVSLDGKLVVMDADGSNRVTLSDGAHPSWSPDGSRLVFEYAGEIRVIDADGTGERTITKGWNPDWSPTSERIAFDRASPEPNDPSPEPRPTDGPEGELRSSDLEGGDLRHYGPGEEPAWSPLGDTIAYTLRTFFSSVIRIKSEDGAVDRNITTEYFDQPRPSLPAWSPDGQQVLFLKGEELWIVDVDDKMPRRVHAQAGPADWGVSSKLAGLLDGRPCEAPKRFVSLHLEGHLLGRGKVWTNYRRLCSTAGVEVSVWKRTKLGFRLAGRSETTARGRYKMVLKVYGPNGRKPDRPGEYQAQINTGGCAAGRSAWKTHSH